MSNSYDNIMEKMDWFYYPKHIDIGDADIKALENQISATLPDDYRHFLQKYGDTGTGEDYAYCTCDDPKTPSGSVESFFGITPGADDLFRTFTSLTGRIPKGYLPVVRIAGGLLLLGLTGSNRGKVFSWDMEERSLDPEKNIYLIAHTFDNFMKSLVADED